MSWAFRRSSVAKLRVAAAGTLILVALTSCAVTVHEQRLLPAPRYRGGVIPQLDRRNVSIAVDEKTSLRGWYLTRPDHRRSLIYFGPNEGIVYWNEAELYWLAAELRCDVLAVDYRGYGISDGSASAAALLSDALKTYDYLADSLAAPRPPFLFGFSLGTFAALHTAGRRPVAGLVLEAAPPSVEDVVRNSRTLLPWYVRWFVRLQPGPELRQVPKPVELAREIRAPMLFLHGAEDRLVPPGQARRVFEAAPSADKRWCLAEGAGHNGIPIRRSPLADSLRAFFGRNDAP